MNIAGNKDAGTWSIDREVDILLMSDSFKDWIGCVSLEPTVRPSFLSDVVYEPDRSMFNEHMAKLISGETSSLEHRIVIAPNELKWVQTIAIPLCARDGAVQRIEGVVLDITERKVEQERIADKLSIYQKLMDTHDVAVWSYDIATQKTLFISETITAITGYEVERARERNFWFDIMHEEDKSFLDQAKVTVELGGSNYSSEHRVIHANGEIRWLQVKVIPYLDGSRSVTRIDGSVTDITTRKKMKENIHRSEQRYRSLFEYNLDAIWELDLLGNVIDRNSAVTTMEGKRFESAQDSEPFIPVFGDQQTGRIKDYFERAIEGQSIHYDMTTSSENGQQLRWEMKNIPIIVNDHIEGAFVIAKNVTEHKKMVRELGASEERYRSLIELSPQPMISAYKGKIVYSNPEGLNLLGAESMEQLIGKSIYDFIHSDYLETVKNKSQKLIENRNIEVEEYKIIRIDDRVIETEAIGIYDDETEMTLIILVDITERLKMERALQESEERYRRLVELSPIAIAVYKDREITYINPAGESMLGLEFNRGTSTLNIIDMILPEFREYASAAMEHTALNGYSIPAEYQFNRADGQVITTSMLSIYDSQSSSIQLMLQDITEKKQVERDLLESEELSRLLIELSPEAIVLHKDYKFIYINMAGLQLFGISNPDELIGQSIFDTIPPEYRVPVTERLEEIYKQRSAVSPHVEQKIIRRDGTEIDVEVIASSLPYKGEIAGITLFRDIRDWKKAEDDRQRAERIIRESEERYVRLQMSLDQFSHDLFGVMKISQMEQRLLQEIRAVLGVSSVELLNVDDYGDKLCEIIETDKGYSIKIGESKGKSCLLYIHEKPITLMIISKRVWLETLTRYVSVLYDNFLLIENLTQQLEQAVSEQVAPTWLLRFMFQLSENERKRLAQDLHDSALQEQIIWYRKLDLLITDKSLNEDIKGQLSLISEGLLDVVYQLRITCNELRPPMLLKDGLISSLEALFSFTQLRSDYRIHLDAESFQYKLTDDILINLYRLVQELLANASKHSSATEVRIAISSSDEQISLVYEDNGVGMDLTQNGNSLESMGMYGMRERVRSMEGTIQFRSSANEGLAVNIAIPAQ